jgi:hypothetical protein
MKPISDANVEAGAIGDNKSLTTSMQSHGLAAQPKQSAIDRNTVIGASASALIGAVLGWAVSALFQDPTKIELWIVIALSILVSIAIAIGFRFLSVATKTVESSHQTIETSFSAFNNEIDKKLDTMLNSNKNVQKLVEDCIGRQAALIPRDLVYKEMATSIRNAQREVVVITYLMVDWETGKRTFAPAAVDTPHRGEFYDAVFEVIKNPKVSYIRVWEVPHQRIDEALQVIESDENQKKECALIREVSAKRPDQANFIITHQLTTASFILIDREELFFNIDFYDPQKNIWHSPYMLYVKDVSGEAFSELQAVIVRLTGHSSV